MVMRKYPMYLDVKVTPYVEGSLRYENPYNRKRYEVVLVIHEKDNIEGLFGKVDEYVRDIVRYMDVEVMGVYTFAVNDEEWKEWEEKYK